MSDFDDYFSDDLILDESTLAALDAEEDRFKQSQQHPPPTQPGPPPKRQKTDQGWKHSTQSDSFYEDLPEISVTGDGSYGVATLPNTARVQTPVAPRNRVPSRGRPSAPLPQGQRPQPPSQRQQPPARQVLARQTSVIQPPARPPQPRTAPPINRGSESQSSNPNQRPPPRTAAPNAPLSDEMAALRQQLEDVCRSSYTCNPTNIFDR